jgi:hypothetical protein
MLKPITDVADMPRKFFYAQVSSVRETMFNYYLAVIISMVVLKTFVKSTFSRRRISLNPYAAFYSVCGTLY